MGSVQILSSTILNLFFSSRESDASKKNEPVIDWLDANVGRVSENLSHLIRMFYHRLLYWLESSNFFLPQAEVQTPEMIRLLTTVVAESVIDGIGVYFPIDHFCDDID